MGGFVNGVAVEESACVSQKEVAEHRGFVAGLNARTIAPAGSTTSETAQATDIRRGKALRVETEEKSAIYLWIPFFHLSAGTTTV